MAAAKDVHPAAFVTVKLYVPAVKPVSVTSEPVPEIAPGLMVQVPVGRPLISTLPLDDEQLGCVIKPMTGVEGVTGCILITTSADISEVHPAAFVTI